MLAFGAMQIKIRQDIALLASKDILTRLATHVPLSCTATLLISSLLQERWHYDINPISNASERDVMVSVSKNRVRVENYVHKGGGGDLFFMFKRVRCTTDAGETFYFKELVVPNYLVKAIKNNAVNTLYTVDINNGKAHCLVAYENDNVSKFDADELGDIARGFRRSGLFFWLGGSLASFLSLIAYGLGLILFPIVVYMGWKYYVKIPKLLSRDGVIAGLKSKGFRFPSSAPFAGSASTKQSTNV